MKRYDVIVVGGGHAGIEAAWAAARMGAEVALVTFDRNAIGRMSCNPAIGGLGKGHMVREIDALGGLMALATDEAGLQFRILNRSKGPAVWAPRVQCDRDAYPQIVQKLLARARTLEIVAGSVESLCTNRQLQNSTEPPASACAMLQDSHSAMEAKASSGADNRPRITGVTLADGRRLQADAVVITTGTFLRGLMHCGSSQVSGGRVGEPPAGGLSRSLEALGIELGRLKTGTPPRIHRDTVDYEQCEVQPGDDPPTPVSLMTDWIPQRQLPCWVTWTNEVAHERIRANLHRAPMYSGQIASRGPRYCPSIEDKVVRFADKPRHQVFLEPEGYDNERIYCNGISTSLPEEVQDDMVRNIPGLQQARILQYGYAVEYDFVPTHQTCLTLETKRVAGLFLAGQINGTSGYEEAAGQGLVAGVNAARHAAGRCDEPFVLGRDQAYIGVMIDDLITRPPTEPYRMFTSRAEYRLHLRSDNADRRLTPVGRALGLVDDERWHRFSNKCQTIAHVETLVRGCHVEGTPLSVWLRRPDADVTRLSQVLAGAGSEKRWCVDALDQVLVEARYAGYVDRQTKEIERFRKLESLAIPPGTDYRSMNELRAEARECLARVEPVTLGQAARVSGINPADVTVLWIYLTGRRRSA